ncbi:CBS domain-containing protein [Actinacidiphila bryophytorum]|uniref:CBS domain-containing protein n=1 Tax=Actinacidiphila bryophytorum TaxID=1436133 RepID=A0A9W4GZK1_9ACTN|nr:CBS domain-containing protein [Actinacidiphila bryophytorum]MBM9438408.1 CBS domain-containing protein [Actinacidiphila bryophytorum]MBN6542318.1 CBS domain-containing protein [Actinacidiphila bryophytorum]CAG7613905.1 CBS domain-containing protein [Actinacidiphila bryophytorum]
MFASGSAVRDVMTRTVVALGPEASFKEIARTMKQRKVSALPVLAGEDRVVGVVSEADLLAKEEFRGSDPRGADELGGVAGRDKAGAVTARDLMTAPAVCVHEDATVSEAARIMARRGVKRLPVVDGEDRLRGIVSRCDLLTVFLREDEEIAADVRRSVLHLLFPGEPSVAADVHDGLVTLRGHVREPALITVATRLARTVEGVVDVRTELTGPPAP